MTDAASQFLILICLTATGAGTGSALALVNFADRCINGRFFFRFIAEFSVIVGFGALLWLTILTLCHGQIRAFYLVTPTVFGAIFAICISKLHIPRVCAAKKALNRFVSAHSNGFIAKYILK